MSQSAFGWIASDFKGNTKIAVQWKSVIQNVRFPSGLDSARFQFIFKIRSKAIRIMVWYEHLLCKKYVIFRLVIEGMEQDYPQIPSTASDLR